MKLSRTRAAWSRPVRPGLAGLGALAMLAACGDARDPQDRSEDPPAPVPADAGDARSAPAALRAIVTRNLGPLADGMTQVAVEVRGPGDEAPTTILAALPDRIRRMTPDGVTAVATPDGCFAWAAGSPARPADPTTTAELTAWRTALDLLTLAPFRRAVSAQRVAPDTLEVEIDGFALTLRYRSPDDTVLAVAGRDVEVRILAHHDSGAARVPTRIDSPQLGDRSIRFLGTGIGFDPAAFDVPTADPDTPRAEILLGGSSSPKGPRLETLSNVSWWMIEDPGTWAERLACIRTAGRRLGTAGYGNGGDPILVEEDEESWLVVPFRPARANPDPVLPENGERVLDRAGVKVLILEPDPAPSAERVTKAFDALAAHADAHGLGTPQWTAASWNLIGRDPATDPGCLDRAPLRVMLGFGR